MGDVVNEYFALVFIKEKNMEDSEIRKGYFDILALSRRRGYWVS